MTMPEHEIITSRDNARIKRARKIREGNVDGRMFVEGVRLCEELLRSSVEFESVFVSEQALSNERAAALVDALRRRGADVHSVKASVFDALPDTRNSQGIVVTVLRPDDSGKALNAAFAADASVLPIVVVLHRANNPSNVGSVFRTAEAAGTVGIILTGGSADAFSPKALRASMGSAFRLPVWRTATLLSAVGWGKERGLIATGADVGADTMHYSADWQSPRLLVFGSEAHGLSGEERELMAELIKIPLANGVESLNLAVSSGIILFEAVRTASR